MLNSTRDIVYWTPGTFRIALVSLLSPTPYTRTRTAQRGP